MTIKDHHETILKAVKAGSYIWTTAFNAGGAQGCANQYEDNATMRAEPFGQFVGRKKIEGFWQNLIDEGYSDVEYIDPQFTIIDSSSGLLKSGQKMDKGSGVIHRELQMIQADGNAKLREDYFEATG